MGLKAVRNVPVLPHVYEELKAQNKELEDLNRKLVLLLSNDRSQVMRDMIIKLEKDIKSQLKAIAVEFIYVNYNREERICLVQLIEEFRAMADEMEKLLDKI